MEAWQKREGEQQELLKSTHQLIRESIEEMSEKESDEYRHFLAVAASLLQTLREGEGGIVKAGSDLFANRAIAKIDEFARTPEEGKIIKIRLLEKLLVSGFSRAQGDYLGQCVHGQEKLYQGHRAMDEVE